MSFAKIIAPYDALASEYYDAQLHPTCANFGELSSQFLSTHIRKHAISTRAALEVGAGNSILAEVFEKERVPLSRVTILDQSAAIIRHSKRWISAGATPRIADASRTGLPAGVFDLIVASLGDPYDTSDFWQEMRRVISNSGIFLFTTPSYEWSSTYRRETARDKAEFVLRDGRGVLVPSYIRPLSEERTHDDLSWV